MSTFTLSRPRRLLAILACALGILAVAFVLATLVLLTVDGHPGGLLAAGAGTAVPVVLWGAWRLAGLANIRLRSPVGLRYSRQGIRIQGLKSPAGSPASGTEPQGSADPEVTANAELKLRLERISPLLPPTRTIYV